jgi:ribosomal protein S18 acetylase RimI-like enzyme
MEQTVPAGFAVRSARPEDAEAVTALVAASQEALHGEAEISRASVMRKWRAPHFDLGRDAWLVQTDDGRVVAFGAVRESVPGEEFEGNLAVHPDYRGLGLGMYILVQEEERVLAALAASGSSTASLHTWSSAGGAEGELFAKGGYRRIAVFSRMEKDLATEPQPPAWPEGIEPRAFRRGADDAAVYTALVEAFGEDDGDLGVDAAEWSRDVVGDPRAEPDLWLLACEGGEVVGVAVNSFANGRGVIERLAVRPAWEGRGIGGALLRAAFGILRRRGAAKAVLAVELGVAVEALDLYRRAGMEEVRRIEFFEKRIAPPMDF